MSFHERFEIAREEAVLTLRDIAHDLNVSFQSVQKWEKGINTPRGKRQEELAQLLAVSVSWLMFGQGEQHVNYSVIKLLSDIHKKKDTVDSFIKEININKKTFDEWRKSNVIPSDMVAKVARARGLSEKWLIASDSNELKQMETQLQIADKLTNTKRIPDGLITSLRDKLKIIIPIYENIEASAGDGSNIEEEIATDHMLVETQWLQEIVHHVPKDMAIIKVKGDSMEPTLSPGDMILVDRKPVERNQLNDGIYVINRNGNTHVKRLQNIEDGIRIISDNKEFYEPEIVTDGLIVCGRVIWAWQGKRF